MQKKSLISIFSLSGLGTATDDFID